MQIHFSKLGFPFLNKGQCLLLECFAAVTGKGGYLQVLVIQLCCAIGHYSLFFPLFFFSQDKCGNLLVF